MTFEMFTVLVAKAKGENPTWRMGQTAFNVLATVNPVLSEAVRGHPDLDPYYQDEKIPALFDWAAANWNRGR